MPPKKSRHPSFSPSSSSPSSSSSSPIPSSSSALTVRAVQTLWRGNYDKSLRLLTEAILTSSDSDESLPLLHRVLASAHYHLGALISVGSPRRRRHLEAAKEAARRAAEMQPDSVDFCRFYACCVYEMAGEMREFDGVVAECDRGLRIENPRDPAVDSVEKVSRQGLGLTKSGRVEKVRRQLLELIHKCNTASVTSFVNALTTNNNASLPPITFTLTSLHQPSFPTQNPSLVHMDRVRVYWDSLPAKKQTEFLRPRVRDMMTHYRKDVFTRAHEEILLNIFYHMEAYETCQIWRCFRCQDEIFTDIDALMCHVSKCHMGKLVGEREFGYLDKEANSYWADKVTDLKPSSLDDCERTEILTRIQTLFGLLKRSRGLSCGCLGVVMRFAIEESYKAELDCSSESSPISIASLDGSGLKKVLEFLELVCQCCVISGLNETVRERSSSFVETVWLDTSEAAPCHCSGFLMLDGVEKERILEWIYEGFSCDESLTEWTNVKREKVERGLSILRVLEKQAYLLKCLYGAKKHKQNRSEIFTYELALNKIDALIIGCTMGIRNLKQSLGRISYFDYRAVLLPFMKSFLQARLEELAETESRITENQEPEVRTQQLQIS